MLEAPETLRELMDHMADSSSTLSRRADLRSMRDEPTESDSSTADSAVPLPCPTGPETRPISIMEGGNGDPDTIVYQMSTFLGDETESMSPEQLDDEVRKIYAGLVMVDKKRMRIDTFRQRAAGALRKESITSQTKNMIEERKVDSKSHTFTDREVRIFEIPCQVAEHTATALGDYGAAKNFMTEKYALDLGLPINRNLTRKITIGSGKKLSTVGTATAQFRFGNEEDAYSLKFHILSKGIHNLVIGRPFLKLTKTFSDIANRCRRVKERIIHAVSQFPVLFMASGGSAPMFEGYINGQEQKALADSGSKVLIMDKDYAKSIGVRIQTGHEHRNTLKFADGSVVDTVGMAYDVSWRFGSDGELSLPFSLNFHVMRNAPANVVLNDAFLYDTHAFSEYQDFLIDEDDDDIEDDKCVIHFLFIGIDTRRKLARVNANSLSLADFRHLELVRRGEEADRISTLQPSDRAAAQIIEEERCTEWNRLFNASQTQNMPQRPPTLSAATVQHPQQTISSHPRLTTVRRWRSTQALKAYDGVVMDLALKGNWRSRTQRPEGGRSSL